MKRFVNFLKIALPIGIIVWLVSTIDAQQRAALVAREKDWTSLLVAFATVLVAVCISFVRWFLLVRTLGLQFRLKDAFRLGFLAYLLNFVSLGSVGGDLFKAVFIAREQPGRRTQAVATVVMDRVLGLYGLLLLTTAALLVVGMPPDSRILSAIASTTYLATAGCTLFVILAMTPQFSRGPIARRLVNLPSVGTIVARALESIQIYQSRRRVMVVALGLSVCIHALLAVGVFFIANTLFRNTPPLREHFLIVPLGNVAASLPFMPAGLGSYEFAMEELYKLVPQNGPGDVIGVLVALGYRVITLAIATVGIVYYWSCRQEVKTLMEEAENRAEHEKSIETQKSGSGSQLLA